MASISKDTRSLGGFCPGPWLRRARTHFTTEALALAANKFQPKQRPRRRKIPASSETCSLVSRSLQAFVAVHGLEEQESTSPQARSLPTSSRLSKDHGLAEQESTSPQGRSLPTCSSPCKAHHDEKESISRQPSPQSCSLPTCSSPGKDHL